MFELSSKTESTTDGVNIEEEEDQNGYISWIRPDSISRTSEQLIESEDQVDVMITDPEPNRFKAFLSRLNPLEEWNERTTKLGKLWLLIRAPVAIALDLTIPVVDLEKEDNGWNRNLHAIQLAVAGPMMGLFLQMFHIEAVIVSLVVCIIFLLVTKEER